jgi:MATE family multidrug resistance protein
MCNPTPAKPSSFLCPKKPQFGNKPNKTMDPYTDDDQEEQLHGWPTPSEVTIIIYFHLLSNYMNI